MSTKASKEGGKGITIANLMGKLIEVRIVDCQPGKTKEGKDCLIMLVEHNNTQYKFGIINQGATNAFLKHGRVDNGKTFVNVPERILLKDPVKMPWLHFEY